MSPSYGEGFESLGSASNIRHFLDLPDRWVQYGSNIANRTVWNLGPPWPLSHHRCALLHIRNFCVGTSNSPRVI